MHVIELPSRKVNIQWGMYAQRLYCERYNIPDPIAFFEMFADERKLPDIIPQLLLIGAEYAAIKNKSDEKFTIIDACEWVDEGGGLSEDGEIMKAFVYIISGHKINLTENSIVNPEKKI